MRSLKSLMRRDTGAATRRAAEVAEIRSSGLFDSDWYLATYPDVAASGADPVQHYVMFGAAEGRNPGPKFSLSWYIGECPAAAAPGTNPILHFLHVGRGMGLSPTPLDEGQAFDSFLAASRAGLLPFAENLRSKISHVHYALHSREDDLPEEALPLPPLELAVRIGSNNLTDFEWVGAGVKRTIARCLPPDFDFKGTRCLDFGCGIGRVIRHFAAEARSAEFWGCDIDGTSIRWAVETMTPPFRFYQMSQAPSLPFEDSSFDLIYAVGVFSQVYEDWHQWAVELRRVLKPGGYFFMSYAGQTPFEEMLSLPYDGFDPHPGLYIANPFNSWNRGGPMVFMSPQWVQRHWGSIFDIEFLAPDALLDYQSICFMRKPERGTPPRMGGRRADIATHQIFDADAFGKIWANCDQSRPFLDSYGIEASGSTEISGWIALRDDEPVTLNLTVDDTPIGSETAWEAGAPYRDWSNCRETVFRTRFDASALDPRRCHLTVRVTGRNGKVHHMSIPLLIS